MNDHVRKLLALQSGVISRRQVHEAGLQDHDIRRVLRRREWATVYDGVYVDHTGALDWTQRAWAAVLGCWPAALSHESARRGADGPGRHGFDDGGKIHVAVESNRAVRAPNGVTVHRLADLDAKVLWQTSPPRQRIEHAVIDLAAESVHELDAVGHLADAVRARLTTGARLHGARPAVASHGEPFSTPSSMMSRRAHARLSSTATSPASSERTACRQGHAR